MTQPFTLNHDADNFTDVIGLTKKEIEAEIDRDPLCDVSFAIGLLVILGEHKGIGAVLASVLSGILGRELGRPSELAEYIVRTVTDRDARELITKALIFADETTTSIDPKDAVETFIRKLINGSKKD